MSAALVAIIMSADTLTIVFSVCDRDGELDAEYRNALGLSCITYDCELILGIQKQDSSVVSSHLTVLVPRRSELKNGVAESPALGRTLTRFKPKASGYITKIRENANSLLGLINETASSRNRSTARLGSTTGIFIKWAKDELERERLYKEAELYLAQLQKGRLVKGREFLGYYEALACAETFALAIFKEGDGQNFHTR